MTEELWAPQDMAAVATLTDAELFGEPDDELPGDDDQEEAHSHHGSGLAWVSSEREEEEEEDEPEIDVANDELLLRVVLARRPFAPSARARASAWDAIVGDFVASGGANVSSRADVTRRLGLLTLTLFERPQALSVVLRGMVLAFHEANCKAGYGARLGVPFLDVLRHNATYGQLEPATPSPTTRPSRRATRGTYQSRAVGDAWLCRCILAHRPFDAAPSEKTAAWIQVLDAFNAGCGHDQSLLLTHMAAQSRLRRATAALVTQDHRYHACLPPALRRMLVEVSLLDFRAQSEMRRTWDGQERNKTARSHKHAHRDELLVRTVLDKQPFDEDKRVRLAIWTDVASAYSAASGETVLTARAAKVRFGRLVNIALRNPRGVSPVVYAMILKYYEQNCVLGAPTAMHRRMLERLRKNAAEVNAAKDATPHELPGITGGVDLSETRRFASRGNATASASTDEESDSVASTHHGGDVCGSPRAGKEAHNEFMSSPGRHSCETVSETTHEVVLIVPTRKNSHAARIAALDESLMRTVLDTRPYLLSAPRDALWNAAATRLAQTAQTMPDGEAICARSVRTRVEWLKGVFQDDDHAEHGQLSTALRLLLTEYTSFNNAKLLRVLGSLYTPKPGATPSKVTLVRESLDDILLREILRIRFKPGESKSAWQAVARAVNNRVGAVVFLRGKTCKLRAQKLLAVYGDPLKRTSLRPSEHDKLKQLEAIKQATNAGAPASESVDAITQPRSATVVSLDGSRDDQSRSAVNELAEVDVEPEVEHEPESEPAVIDVRCVVTGILSTARRKRKAASTPSIEDGMSSSTQAEATCGHISPTKRHRVSEGVEEAGSTSENDVAVDKITQQHQPTTPVAMTSNAEIVAMVARMGELLVHLESERQEHRAQHNRLMEVLKSEREAQLRETRHMLDMMTATSTRNAVSAPSTHDLGRDGRSKRRRIAKECDKDDGFSKAETTRDEIIFRVAMKHHPFPVDRGLRRDAWDKIATEVNQQFGKHKHPPFRNGPKVLAHIAHVLELLEREPSAFSVKIRNLAAQYVALQPPRPISRRPRLAQRSSPSYSEPVDHRPPSQETAHQLAECVDVEAQAVALHCKESDRPGVDTTEVPTTHNGVNQQRGAYIPTSGDQGEFTTERNSLTRLLLQLERERLDHQAQQQVLVELLKAEREAHSREMQAERETQRQQTNAALEAINRERQNRHEELVALTKLIIDTRGQPDEK